MSESSHLPPEFRRQAFYTPDELAGILRVHVSTVREWIRSDRLFAYRISERVTRIPLGSVMELLGESQAVTRRTLTPDEEAAAWNEAEVQE